VKPRLLDLFCGAGGCTKGYQEAGFYVVGVDMNPQPNYCGDEFLRADAVGIASGIAWSIQNGREPQNGLIGSFAAIHASPPCQAHTSMRHFGKGAGEGAPELIAPTRELLIATGLPYVIENVVGAPLLNPYRLCGSSFGLGVWRHRLFETNFPMMVPTCQHYATPKPIAVYGDHPQTSGEKGTHRVRRARSLGEGQAAMGIDWMPWKELTQAIPPAMTEHIGSYLLSHIEAERASSSTTRRAA
jgi:DNA (cytosine-5)-methyltransferase 1